MPLITPAQFGGVLLGFAKGIDMNTLGDVQININLPPGTTKWTGAAGLLHRVSGAGGTFKMSMWSQPNASGTALFASVQDNTTAAGFDVPGARSGWNPNSTAWWDFTTVYLHRDVVQGAASSCDYFLYGWAAP